MNLEDRLIEIERQIAFVSRAARSVLDQLHEERAVIEHQIGDVA